MEIVSAGSLESISRPSSTTSEKGRKSQLKRLQPSSSLEILPPEDVCGIPSELFTGIEKDVDIKDFEDCSSFDEEELSDYESDGTQEDYTSRTLENTQEYQSSRSSRSTQEDHSSMASEIPALEDSDVDPQIREGMERIKKLDKILSDKLKKEKEVKNQRIQMEKMWKEQLQQMVQSQQNDGTNTNRNLLGAALLALELGNEESLGSSRDSSSTPIFATQPLGTESESVYQASTSSGSTSRASSVTKDKTNRNTRNKTKHSRKEKKRPKSQSEQEKSTTKKQNKAKDGGQDFIERNKKLAADAANVIPMTVEEKERLEKLLATDVNEMIDADNPFTNDLRITQGSGFIPDEVSALALADIDRKLKELLPADEIEMLSSRDSTWTPITCLSAGSDMHNDSQLINEGMDDIDIGEKVLREEKESRTLKQRVVDIEKQLENLRNLTDDDQQNSISQSLLSKLLNEDTRTTSSNSTIAQTVVSSLGTPDQLAIESLKTIRTDSALSDVTLTSDVTVSSSVMTADDVTIRDVESPLVTSYSKGKLMP